jgi:hypothetical protein
MRVPFIAASLLCCLFLVSSCGDDGVDVPAAPTPVRTFVSFAIYPHVPGAPPTSTVGGYLHNLIAATTYRDGFGFETSQNVSRQAVWTNSNRTVADGIVEPCNAGDAAYCMRLLTKFTRGVTTLTATFDGRTASYTLTVQ